MIFHYYVDLKRHTATVINGGTAKIPFTRRRDIGFALAEALSDPRYVDNGDYLCLQAETMTWKDALALLEKVTGQTFTYKNISTLDAQEEEKALQKQYYKQHDRPVLVRSLVFHLLRVPAAGWEGLDMSSVSETFNIPMSRLPIP